MTPCSRLATLCLSVAVLAVSYAMADDPPTQESFFAAMDTGRTKPLLDLMGPELRIEVDEPVLEVWQKSINERLGKVVAVNETASETRQTLTGKFVDSTATVQFERGTANSALTIYNGKLLAFNVTSDDLGNDWFKGPASTQLYQDLGMTFITRFLADEGDAAYGMFHPALKEVISREELGQMIQTVRTNAGAVKTVTFKDSRLELTPETQLLFLNFDLDCENADGTCEIKIQFVGMRGHLLGFNFQ
jgi:hypothetical protein